MAGRSDSTLIMAVVCTYGNTFGNTCQLNVKSGHKLQPETVRRGAPCEVDAISRSDLQILEAPWTDPLLTLEWPL